MQLGAGTEEASSGPLDQAACAFSIVLEALDRAGKTGSPTAAGVLMGLRHIGLLQHVV